MANISCRPIEPVRSPGANGTTLFGCCAAPTTSSVYVELSCSKFFGNAVDGFYPADFSAEQAMVARVSELLIKAPWGQFTDAQIQGESCFRYFKVTSNPSGPQNFVSANQMSRLSVYETTITGAHVGAVCGSVYPSIGLPTPFRKLQGGIACKKTFTANGETFFVSAQKTKLVFGAPTGGTSWLYTTCDPFFRGTPSTIKQSNVHLLLPDFSPYRLCTSNCVVIRYSAIQPQ